jgi:hypothetical protein
MKREKILSGLFRQAFVYERVFLRDAPDTAGVNNGNSIKPSVSAAGPPSMEE